MSDSWEAIDRNNRGSLTAVSNSDGVTIVRLVADPVSGRLLTDSLASLNILVATGTVNDTNTAFTFIQQPTVIYVNGLGYRLNHGWSWNAGTLTATLDAPVGTNGDIYGI